MQMSGVHRDEAMRGFVAVGPTVVRTLVDGSALWRFGGIARVGAAYDF